MCVFFVFIKYYITNKMKQNDKDDLKDDILGLINETDTSNFPSIEIDPISPLDLTDLDQKTKTKAQNIVLSCMKLYFDAKIISKNEFMAAKASVTTSNIKTLFRQIRVSEHMIDKIVNGIDSGDMNPRLFEVAGQLQSNIVDMLKNVQLHVISMQEEFRRMQGELPKQDINDDTINIDNDTKIYTNAKSLLKDLDESEDAKLED